MMMISGDALMGNFMGEKAVKKNTVIRTAPAVAGDSLMGNFMGVETNSGRKVFDGSLAPRAGVPVLSGDALLGRKDKEVFAKAPVLADDALMGNFMGIETEAVEIRRAA